MLAVEFLSKCRSCYPSFPDNDLLSHVEAQITIGNDDQGNDINEKFRWDVCEELNRTLGRADIKLVRYLLEQEIILHRVIWDANEPIQLCARMLYQFGQAEDSLLIWKAKNTNFDTTFAVDPESMLGASLDDTRHFLKEHGSQEAQDALSYIEECAQEGRFDSLEQQAMYRKIHLR